VIEPTLGQRLVPVIWLQRKNKKSHAFLLKREDPRMPEWSLCGSYEKNERWESKTVPNKCVRCERQLKLLRDKAEEKERAKDD
jgi:hypothetical protein